LAAVAIGFVAARLNLWGIAPIGLLSIGVGILLGITLGGLAALRDDTGRRRLVLGTVAWAIFTVLAEHGWLYHDFRRQWHEARVKSVEVALFRPAMPWSPTEYFGREASAGRLVLWACEAALLAAAAAVTVVLMNRQCRNSLRKSTELADVEQRN
jgi:hypothetical protein